MFLALVAAPLHAGSTVSLTLVPPSPVTEQIAVEIRGAVGNRSDQPHTAEIALYLDGEHPGKLLYHARVELAAKSARGVSFCWPAKGHTGRHRIILVARCGPQTFRAERPVEVLASNVRSTRRIDGAWMMFDVPPDAGGSLILEASRKLTDGQWAEMVRASHELGMNVIVVECVFDNFSCKPGQYHIDRDGYQATRQDPYYEDQNWQGYWGTDLEATIDLDRPIPLATIRSDYLQRTASGIYLPAWVQYAVSDDGTQFRVVATLKNEVPTERAGPFVQSFAAKLNGVSGRYVRVHAKSVRTIPAGQPAAGQKAWLFVDEILVNPQDRKE